jgi:hypothetical protein
MMIFAAGSGAGRRIRPLATALALCSSLLFGGCASDFAFEDAVPQPSADGTYGGPRDTGQYPNLNVPQKGATSQFTPSDVSAKTSELNGARTGLEAQPADVAGFSADAVRLRQVGEKRPAQVLKDIEGQ